jgi:hypothetical protein
MDLMLKNRPISAAGQDSKANLKLIWGRHSIFFKNLVPYPKDDE